MHRVSFISGGLECAQAGRARPAACLPTHPNPHRPQSSSYRFAGNQAEREASDAAEAAAKLTLGEEKAPAEAPGKKVKNKKAAPADPATNRPVDVSRVDLRVGLIKKAWKHPGADRWQRRGVDSCWLGGEGICRLSSDDG